MPAFDTRRSFLKATGAGAVTLSLAGCLDGDGQEEPGEIDPGEIDEGGNFIVGYPTELESPNALTASSAYTWGVLDLIFEPGVHLDPEPPFEVRPWAYTDWEYEEDGDGMNVLFDVRDGVTWNDGEAFTVDDVVFTYEYYMDQEPGRYLSFIRPIDAVEEGDDWDVRLSMNQQVGTWKADQLGGMPLLPEHVWSDVDDHVEYDPDPEEVVGLGPGVITTYEPDTVTEVEFRDDYTLTELDWVVDHDLLIEGGPFLDAARWQVFGSGTALQQNFRAGDVDAIYDDAVDLSTVETLRDEDGIRVVEGQDDGYRHYTVNMRSTPFDDQTFRQAMQMAMDNVHWAEQLNYGYMEYGNFVVVPAYEHIRPEVAADAGVNDDPAVEALWYREKEEGVLDVEAVRSFLDAGEVISGEQGEYAGREYPGSLTDFGETFQTESRYEYSFGEVQSPVLEDAGVDRELYVDGQPFEEFAGGPLTMLDYPPGERPTVVDMTERYIEDVRSLGVPIDREVVAFNTMSDRVFIETDFDVFAMGWSNTSTRGIPMLYSFYHSDNAHAEDSDFDAFAYNAAGYGLEGFPGADETIDEARTELDEDRRDRLTREVTEQMYLEAPTFVKGYDLVQWPVHAEGWSGFIEGIPAPGSGNMHLQFRNIHRNQD